MDALKITRHAADVSWNYDGEADVLYLSLGEPVEALGVDIGDGVVVRVDETTNQVVGLTVLALRSRLTKGSR